MNKPFDSSSVGVLASVAEYGVSGKADRAVFAEAGALPSCLTQSAGVLNRFAQRCGIDLQGSAAEIAVAARGALDRRAVSAQRVNDATPDFGL